MGKLFLRKVKFYLRNVTYMEYLRQRWEQGEHNGLLLFVKIRAQGYPAGLTGVYVAIQPWRTHGPTASLARAKVVHGYISPEHGTLRPPSQKECDTIRGEEQKQKDVVDII
jgi:hypothetical protein